MKTLKNKQKGKSKTSEKLHNVADLDAAYIFTLNDVSLTVKKVGDTDALVLAADGYLNDVVPGGVRRDHGTRGVREILPAGGDTGGAYEGLGWGGDSGSR